MICEGWNDRVLSLLGGAYYLYVPAITACGDLILLTPVLQAE